MIAHWTTLWPLMSSCKQAWTQTTGGVESRTLRVVGVFLSLAFVLIAPSRVAAADSARLVATGDFHAPQLSPDGKTILVTTSRQSGLTVIDRQSGHSRLLIDGPALGVHARFVATGDISFKAKRAGTMQDLLVNAAGAVSTARADQPLAFASNDRIYLRTNTGLRVLATGDRFFDPQVSPDQSKIAFVGLASGIYIYERATRRLRHLGPGTSPAWSPDSSALVYEWTEDDGHSIVGSELWLWRGNADTSVPLTSTENRIERHPSFAPAGNELVFDDDAGAIYLLALEVLP